MNQLNPGLMALEMHEREAFPEQRSRAAQTRCRGAGRNAFCFGDLRNLELLDLSQHQHSTQLVGQRSQELVEQRAGLSELRGVFRLGAGVDQLVGQRFRLFPSTRELASQVRSDPQRDTIEVSPLAATRDALTLAGGGQEYLLSRVIGVFR